MGSGLYVNFPVLWCNCSGVSPCVYGRVKGDYFVILNVRLVLKAYRNLIQIRYCFIILSDSGT